FCCRELKVIIELDGGQHAAQARSDTERTAFLEALGYRVLRFWNNDALGNTDGVLQRIAQALAAARPPPPPPPPQGGAGGGGGGGGGGGPVGGGGWGRRCGGRGGVRGRVGGGSGGS